MTSYVQFKIPGNDDFVIAFSTEGLRQSLIRGDDGMAYRKDENGFSVMFPFVDDQWTHDRVLAAIDAAEQPQIRPIYLPMEQPWHGNLDERQLKEVQLATLYEAEFHHGTDGHHRLLLIAKLAHLLDEWTAPRMGTSQT